jgi:hypothetical protein
MIKSYNNYLIVVELVFFYYKRRLFMSSIFSCVNLLVHDFGSTVANVLIPTALISEDPRVQKIAGGSIMVLGGSYAVAKSELINKFIHPLSAPQQSIERSDTRSQAAIRWGSATLGTVAVVGGATLIFQGVMEIMYPTNESVEDSFSLREVGYSSEELMHQNSIVWDKLTGEQTWPLHSSEEELEDTAKESEKITREVIGALNGKENFCKIPELSWENVYVSPSLNTTFRGNLPNNVSEFAILQESIQEVNHVADKALQNSGNISLHPHIVEKIIIPIVTGIAGVIQRSLKNKMLKVISFPNGNKFEGYAFMDRLIMGKLICRCNCQYEGTFENDQPLLGKKVFHFGNQFEGTFLNGQPNVGKMMCHNGDTYEGTFLNGRLNGEGEATYVNGNKFEGTFENGDARVGKITCGNGDEIVGTFENGLPNVGKMMYHNGNKFEGTFLNGQPNVGKMM